MFEARLEALVVKYDEQLKAAGVESVKRMTFHYESGGEPVTLPYVRFDVALKAQKAAPTMQRPSEQAMPPPAAAEEGPAVPGVTLNPLHDDAERVPAPPA
jgi:hypothetical protein